MLEVKRDRIGFGTWETWKSRKWERFRLVVLEKCQVICKISIKGLLNINQGLAKASNLNVCHQHGKISRLSEKVMKLRRETVKVNDLGVGKLMMVKHTVSEWGGLPRALDIWKRKVIT